MKHFAQTHYRALAFALLCTLTLSTISCGDTVNDPYVSNTSSDETNESYDTVASDKDELPELKFGGREFRILAAESTAYKGYIDVAETNGDVLNDTIFEANRAVEARFDVSIVQESLGAVEANDTGAKIILAGDHEYDIISFTDRNALQHAVDGLLLSYADMPYIDLSKDYWCQSINESITINGKQWLAYGDFNLSVYDYTYTLLYNKQLHEELQLDDLYTLVEDGKWTLDVFNKMCISAVFDLNGDTIIDKNDRYGYSAVSKQISPTLWIAAGVTSIKKDSNDLPYFSMASDSKFQEVYEKIIDICYSNDVWCKDNYNGNVTNVQYFREGNSLFQTTSFGLLDNSYYREMEIDFGVIPHPKYDESQENYYSRVEGGRIFAIPVTTEDTEFTGLMLEALSASAHENIIPVYYETAIKTKYSRDDESSKMLDIIMDSRVYDLGDTFWCKQIRDGFIMNLFYSGSKDLASAIAQNKESVEAQISETVSALSK